MSRYKYPTSGSPRVEFLERRELLSTTQFATDVLPLSGARPVEAEVAAAVASPSTTTFIDPTAVLHGARAITLGDQVYVAPFATLVAQGGATISIGNGSNVQDNVLIRSTGLRGSVVIGDHAILAHNATVIGPATIGAPGGAAAFVGFNAVIDGATVEPGAMVLGQAKVAPGIVIRSGFKVLQGAEIHTQAEADQPALGKVGEVNSDDIGFMNNVIHVNETLAEGYSKQAAESPSSVRGVGPNPSAPPFNPVSSIPTLDGVPTLAPRFRNRIIGDVRAANSLGQLRRVMAHHDSIRADEATPFLIGRIARMGNRVTIHGLEFSNLTSEDGDSFGYHSVIHAGDDSGQDPQETTFLGRHVRVGAWSVVFKSTIGDGCVIGPHAYIEASTLAPGTIVPRGAILINNVYQSRI